MPIINGVEVEGCSYYNIENEPYACEIWNNECCAQDCYWKQLQRAKAENEKLEQYKALDEFLKGKIDYKQTIADIVKENEKLKEELNKYEK